MYSLQPAQLTCLSHADLHNYCTNTNFLTSSLRLSTLQQQEYGDSVWKDYYDIYIVQYLAGSKLYETFTYAPIAVNYRVKDIRNDYARKIVHGLAHATPNYRK